MKFLAKTEQIKDHIIEKLHSRCNIRKMQQAFQVLRLFYSFIRHRKNACKVKMQPAEREQSQVLLPYSVTCVT